MRRKPILSFIGAGSVGTALAVGFHRCGYRVVSVISSSPKSARRLAKLVGAPIGSGRIEDLSPESQVVFLATPDHAIVPTAEKLSRQDFLDFPSMVFVHTSGALGSDVLSNLQERGGHILSLHPIQLFPRNAKPQSLAKRLYGIYYGLEGDERGILVGKKLVRDFGGKPLLIRKEVKPLYHIACVVASNYLVALMSLLDEVYSKLKLSDDHFLEVFDGLIASTIGAMKAASPVAALTGPIERGEVATVRLHLRELNRTLPYLVPFYTVMGMETIRLAVKKGSLSTKKAEALLEAMSGYIRQKAPTELLAYYEEHKN